MNNNKFIVITTINKPSKSIRIIAEKLSPIWSIVVVGDKKTPTNWKIDKVKFLSIKSQKRLGLNYEKKCPYNHYSRKNIGYLYSIKNGAQIIAETDDDNIPYSNFLSHVEPTVKGLIIDKKGWVNTYRYFSEYNIWPRGFPLEYINDYTTFTKKKIKRTVRNCPIQQFLSDGDPDVDAIFRLLNRDKILFKKNSVIISKGQYCPFNSQNTIWWKEAFPLLYLPSYVSFRMTDIWRSFIAQICLSSVNHCIAFMEPSTYQKRNKHVLLKDFKEEIPGYLENKNIVRELSKLNLSKKNKSLYEKLFICYEKLVEINITKKDELILLSLWIKDLENMENYNSNTES